ncbi:MAG TPA: hypothetical protein PLV68_18975 [Ilumatobacteraceae bacterium]|nr:hypothetical protein [Ilumatobacteraceae bacterium]
MFAAGMAFAIGWYILVGFARARPGELLHVDDFNRSEADPQSGMIRCGFLVDWTRIKDPVGRVEVDRYVFRFFGRRTPAVDVPWSRSTAEVRFRTLPLGMAVFNIEGLDGKAATMWCSKRSARRVMALAGLKQADH